MNLQILNAAGSLTSIILAVLAIVLSIWFFVQSKNTEGETKKALEGIRTQTEALQKLAGRWLDRFTKHLVDDKPFDALLSVAAQVSNLPEKISQDLQVNISQIQQHRSEIISCYLLLQYYTALTNIFAQGNLPLFYDFNESDENHKLVRHIVDQSAGTVKQLETIIAGIPQEEIDRNSYNSFRVAYLSYWAPSVKDSFAYYASSNWSL